jgi:hypothetical protein
MRRIQHALIGLGLVAVVVAIAFAQGPVQSPGGPVWDDLVVPATSINPLGPLAPMTSITDPADYMGCLQADGADETAVLQFQLSHGQQPDSDVHPHVHWIVSGVDVTGSAVYSAQFRHCPLSGTCGAWSGFAVGTTTIEPADSEGATGKTEWELSDATYDFNISSILLMQVKIDSLTVTRTIVCSADLHYQRSSGGTRLETSR